MASRKALRNAEPLTRKVPPGSRFEVKLVAVNLGIAELHRRGHTVKPAATPGMFDVSGIGELSMAQLAAYAPNHSAEALGTCG